MNWIKQLGLRNPCSRHLGSECAHVGMLGENDLSLLARARSDIASSSDTCAVPLIMSFWAAPVQASVTLGDVRVNRARAEVMCYNQGVATLCLLSPGPATR